MDVKNLEEYAEKYINGTSSGSLTSISANASALESFYYNTVKRLLICFDKYKKNNASKDVFLCSLRNYLLVFQNEIRLDNEDIDPENEYGLMKNVEGKYYANLDIPEYIDSDFVDQAYQRKNTNRTLPKQNDVFYGNNAFIYSLTHYKEFKSLEQKIAVFGALNTPEGYTTLVSLPTGGGKSLITQTMAYQKDGLTIVIVPTVSLAIDQVRNAKNNVKHNADEEIFCYYSGIELVRKNALKNAIKNETARLLFISPEALIRNNEFESMINEANSKKYLKNLIIDEAHIVIEWGDFFRVDYQCLEAWRKELLSINSQLRTVLLSATYTQTAVVKLKQMFVDNGKWIEVRCDALRKEPRFVLVKAKSYMDKKKKMVELAKKLPHPMVIYINSPKEAEEIKKTLTAAGLNSLETFTGNTKSVERERIIKDWTDNKIDLMIATSAFGVGVDKADVRTVLHLYIPDTPNQYYQELGRGGRDGLTSLSVMCINPVDDIDSAYKRMNKVLSADKIWGRWLSMYKSPTSSWFKGMVTLDTAVKPIYNATNEDDDASEIDIQWNVYVILLLRRHNMISIKSMIYDANNECYKIRVEILEDELRSESTKVPSTISEMRDNEATGFEREIKRIKNGIEYDEKICWSEMFYSTYDKVSIYCGGCGRHHYPESMEEGKFPLLLPVREPQKIISAELDKLCQSEKEVMVISEDDDYSILNRYLSAGVSIIVLEDTKMDDDFDLILNMDKRSNIMIMGMTEYKEFCKQASGYYVSGGVVALYNSGANKAYEFCNALRKYRNEGIKLIHIVKEDFFIQKVQKPLSSVIEGPKIDSYILERM
ncbi:DEAD/DEAH box helicase [Lacrimispora sp.]|uniref:DEAD/DEAH box helicase n=1 Tax=Lacrimispora sp. TaxID=2719234 RepID=UPI00399274AE